MENTHMDWPKGQCDIWNVTGVAPPEGGDTPDSDGRADSAKGRHGLTAGSWSWKNTHMGSPQGSPHMEPSLAQVTQAYEH